jgi:homoserine acetyltransferase
MAAAESPQIDAVISDSTLLSLQDVVVHHAKLFLHLPSFPIPDEIVYWTAWRGHFRASDFDLTKAVGHINPRPILFIAVQGDRRMPPSIARPLLSLCTSPKTSLVILPGTRHGEGFNLATPQYEEAVSRFLAALSTASDAGGVNKSGVKSEASGAQSVNLNPAS